MATMTETPTVPPVATTETPVVEEQSEDVVVPLTTEDKVGVEVLEGKLLCEGLPAVEDETVKLELLHMKRFIYAREETLKILKKEDHEPFAGGFYLKEHRPVFYGQARLVFYDANDHPVALCLQEKGFGKRYVVCGTKPFVPGDKVYFKEDGVDFYRWLEVRDHRIAVGSYPIMAWTGEKYVHFLKSVPLKQQVRELLPTKHADFAIEDWDCTFKLGHYRKKPHKEVYHTGSGNGFDIDVYPGSDPGLMLAIVACIDRMSPVYE